MFMLIADAENVVNEINESNVWMFPVPKNYPPGVWIEYPNEIRVGQKVKLQGYATDSDGEIVQYMWDFDGDGEYDWVSSTKGSVTRTFLKTGIYNLVFTVMDDDGAIATVTASIEVKPPKKETVQKFLRIRKPKKQ